MANTSIYNAFERLWHHIQVALSNKIEKNTYNDGWVGCGTEGGAAAELGHGNITILGSDTNGAYIACENGDATLIFYGTAGDSPVRLENIATPVSNRDAANKEYVDNIVGDIETLLAAL